MAILTLNRPAKLNALSHELLLTLDGTIAELHDDGAVQVIILTGAARALEAERSAEHSAKVTPASIDVRRRALPRPK